MAIISEFSIGTRANSRCPGGRVCLETGIFDYRFTAARRRGLPLGRDRKTNRNRPKSIDYGAIWIWKSWIWIMCFVSCFQWCLYSFSQVLAPCVFPLRSQMIVTNARQQTVSQAFYFAKLDVAYTIYWKNVMSSLQSTIEKLDFVNRIYWKTWFCTHNLLKTVIVSI